MLDTLKTTLELNNPALLREQAYINGRVGFRRDGQTFDVTNPADGSLVATFLNWMSPPRAAIEARCGLARLASQNGQGALSDSAPLVQPDAGKQG